MLGIRIGSWEKMGAKASEMYEDGAQLAPCYAEIWGRPCEHVVKRGGMGRYSMGVIACGSYSDERAFAPRIQAIEALFRLYRRIPDAAQAQATYACIDSLLDAKATVQTAMHLRYKINNSGKTRLEIFADLLNLTATHEEWSDVNLYAKSGFPDPPPLLTNVELLRKRLRSEHPEIHRAASLLLLELPTEERWKYVSMGLDDPDPKIQENAAWVIRGNHRLELYHDLLEKQKNSYSNDYIHQSIDDTDVAGLLERDDPVTDALCFKAIEYSWRYQFLDRLLAKLKRQDSEATQRAIGDLIAGPKVFYGKTECWSSIKPMAAPPDEMRSIIELGTASKIRDPRKYSFLNACKGLAAKKTASDWDVLQKAYLVAVADGVSEGCAAVMARAMWEIDRTRTASLLKEEIKLNDTHRLTCALASMGLLADREFLDPILSYQKRMAEAKGPQPNSMEQTFPNSYHGQFLMYALHRCRQNHLMTLQRGLGSTWWHRRDERGDDTATLDANASLS